MREIIATVTSKGQVTIPAEVRSYLGIETHDKIAFVLDDEGRVHLRVPRFSSIESLRGAAGCLQQPMSWQEMKQIAYDRDFDRLQSLVRQEP